jgi:hypothetical protein
VRILLALLLAGCAHSVDRDNACRMAQLERDNIFRLSPGELAYLSRGTPAESDAASARSQILAAQSLGAIGAAALVTGLIEGFAGDPATDPAVRASAYSLGGGALGLFATSLILGLTSRNASERARNELRSFADRCRAQ